MPGEPTRPIFDGTPLLALHPLVTHATFPPSPAATERRVASVNRGVSMVTRESLLHCQGGEWERGEGVSKQEEEVSESASFETMCWTQQGTFTVAASSMSKQPLWNPCSRSLPWQPVPMAANRTP